MTNVLVLGDCASNGNSCLTKEITGKHIEKVEYSLAWNLAHRKQIVLWFFKTTKGNRKKIDYDKIYHTAIEYMQEKEYNEAWPSFLPPALNIINMSKGGATAYGYYKRLLKYKLQHGRPDLIIFTDYDPTHPWQKINLDGNRYFFEKNYDERRKNFEVNPVLKSPVRAQELAFSKAKYTYEHGLNQKRNFKIMRWFHKYLEKEKYNFIKVKFYKGFDQFDKDTNVVDCSDLVNEYCVLHGTNGELKKQIQPKIAERVRQKIVQLTFRQNHI